MAAKKHVFLARTLSLLLCLALLAGLVPAALADGGSVSITNAPGTIEVDEQVKLDTKIVKPDGYSISETRWESKTDSIASVDSSGNVKGITAGNATITVTVTFTKDSSSEDGESGEPPAEPVEPSDDTLTASDSCSIEVKAKEPEVIPVNDIQLNETSATLNVKQTLELKATVSPSNATDSEVSWKTDNPAVATVIGGLVTAEGKGSTIITATAGGKSATCTVNVEDSNIAVQGISLPSTMSLTVGTSGSLTATFNPANATNQNITWTSSNTAVATVTRNTNGPSTTVTPVAAGQTVITATTADGGKIATCKVTVTAATVPVTSVTLNQTNASLTPNQPLQLTATVKPDNASNKTVTWSSSNSAIATVSSSGLVTAKSAGTATITATANDGSGQKATCTVTVTTGTLSLNTSSLTLTAKGSASTLTATTAPDTQAANVKWNITGNGGIVTLSTNQGKTCSVTPLAVGKTTVRATVTISGTTYTADCQVTVTSADAADITYSTARGVPVTFSASHFNNTCSALTGRTLNYVNFTLPASSQGTLYYDYKSNGSYDSKVASSTNYYRSSSRYLDRVTFVPNDSFSGTVTISYSARDTQDTAYSGRVIIKVGSNTGTVTYTTDKNKAVTLDNSSFNRFSQDMTGNSFNYIRFTSLPGSSRGTLYYDYDAGDSRHKAVDTSTNYFRNKSSYLDRITFVPKSDFTGTVSIPFTGQDSNGTSFSGTLKFYVGTGAADISYSAASGQAVNFNASDFNDYCKDVTGSTLDYVRFTLPTRGALYYNYSANGNYEKTVSASTSYYRSSSPYLSSVSYVPDANSPTSVLISFTGWSTSRESFSGTVAITYTGPQTVSALRYSTNGSPVVFRSQDFAAVCNLRGTTTLSYVSFSLPNAAQGTLYSNYVSPAQHGTEVMPGIPYYVNSNPPLDGVTFLPKAGFSGTATVSYTARDSAGGTYNGTVNITVTPVTASATFTDVGTNYSWCASSVDFLYKAGVVTGVDNTHYAPAQAISRGDFVLMLYRAFGMRASGNTSFTDVPADSYYAQAIAAAKAMGVATGTGDGTFRPKDPLTRQDAMLLLQRTLSATGQGIAGASDSVISRFSDQAQVASYSRSAVCAMVQAGVIQGDSSGKLNPTQSLTRGEMATILHRVITL